MGLPPVPARISGIQPVREPASQTRGRMIPCYLATIWMRNSQKYRAKTTALDL